MKTFLKHPTHPDIPIQHRKGLLEGRYALRLLINLSLRLLLASWTYLKVVLMWDVVQW